MNMTSLCLYNVMKDSYLVHQVLFKARLTEKVLAAQTDYVSRRAIIDTNTASTRLGTGLKV